MKKVAILQSNYIPWKGYFDIINMVDEFILYDDMQYTRRDWRNRNKIKTFGGVKWLTIPVNVKGKYYQKINETEVNRSDWAEEHWKTIRYNYAHAPYFDELSPWLGDLYQKAGSLTMLSDINYLFLSEICRYLGIRTKLSWSSDYELIDGKTERLAALVKSAGGGFYLSGPAAKDYIQPEVFDEYGIELAYMDYGGYPEYPQLHGDFTHQVSILDLLFMEGPSSTAFMKSFSGVTS